MDASDVGADAWEMLLPELPEVPDHVGGAVVRGWLCIGGGRDSGTRGLFRAVRNAWCCDFVDPVWVHGDDVEEMRAEEATGGDERRRGRCAAR